MAKAPLYRDPIHDGAADPVVIYNRDTKTWFMFYTNRRAMSPVIGESWIHGTDIGIAESTDNGKTWLYRGIAEGLKYERGHNTYWAPEIIWHDGVYHMYVSYVRGIPENWEYDRYILHYTSENLWDWEFRSKLDLGSDRVIDACVAEKPEGGWRMWFKDECRDSHTYYADSDDLYNWHRVGAAVTDISHEGANVFTFGGKNWLITDEWHGLGVYYSDTLDNWKKQGIILGDDTGIREDDGVMANHADVAVCGGRAYIFYFTHPDRTKVPGRNWFRSSIQAAELFVEDGNLICDRNRDFEIELTPEYKI